MKVRSCDLAGRADRGDDVAGADVIAFAYDIAVEMGVTGDQAVAVIDDDDLAPGVAAAIAIGRFDHLAGAGGQDGRSARCLDVDALMGGTIGAESVDPGAVGQRDLAFDGRDGKGVPGRRRRDGEGGLCKRKTGGEDGAGAEAELVGQRHQLGFAFAREDGVEPRSAGAFVEGREGGDQFACKAAARV